MLLLALASLACTTAASPELTTPTLPAPVTVPLVAGPGDLNPESTAGAGFYRAISASLDQALSWEPATGTLAEATAHERSLVYQALGRAPPADQPPLVEGTAAGQPSLSWSVTGGTSRFLGTSFVCGSLRVELTTYGEVGAGDLLEATHAASLAGARCAAPAGG